MAGGCLLRNTGARVLRFYPCTRRAGYDLINRMLCNRCVPSAFVCLGLGSLCVTSVSVIRQVSRGRFIGRGGERKCPSVPRILISSDNEVPVIGCVRRIGRCVLKNGITSRARFHKEAHHSAGPRHTS